MEAGRELDALIAEKVMGWENRGKDQYGKLTFYRQDNDALVYLPNFSSDIEAAWLVVDAMTHDHFYTFGLYKARFDTNSWDAQFGALDRAFAETGPLAICLAALKAFGGIR